MKNETETEKYFTTEITLQDSSIQDQEQELETTVETKADSSNICK